MALGGGVLFAATLKPPSRPAVCEIPSFGDNLRFAKESLLIALYREQSHNDVMKNANCGCPLLQTAEEFLVRNFDETTYKIIELQNIRDKHKNERTRSSVHYIKWFRKNCKDK